MLMCVVGEYALLPRLTCSAFAIDIWYMKTSAWDSSDHLDRAFSWDDDAGFANATGFLLGPTRPCCPQWPSSTQPTQLASNDRKKTGHGSAMSLHGRKAEENSPG